MTPLFQQIIKEDMRAGVGVSHLLNTKCFEVSALEDLTRELSVVVSGLSREEFLDTIAPTVLMPAPACWFEWVNRSGIRTGLLALPINVEHRGRQATHALSVRSTELVQFVPVCVLNMNDVDGNIFAPQGALSAADMEQISVIAGLFFTTLALINTPKIVGRREHAPHKGLAKAIRQTHGKVYQLRPWTEIKLEITPPPGGGDGSREVLTGKKALHFCRAHLRIRRGKLERVTSHWRGDPALGIVRSRYSVSA
jgi:hypothetical protein